MKKRTAEPRNIECPTEELLECPLCEGSGWDFGTCPNCRGKGRIWACAIKEDMARIKPTMEVRMRNVILAIQKIREKHGLAPPAALLASQKKEGYTGTIECPSCKGELRYVIRPGNHHTWGACYTDGCLFWME